MLQRSSASFSFSLSLPYEVISWRLKLFSRFIQSVAARVPSHLAEGREQSAQELHCFLQRIWLPLSLYFLALGNDRLQNQMLHRSLDNNLERWPLLACSVGFLFFFFTGKGSLLCMLPGLKARFLSPFSQVSKSLWWQGNWPSRRPDCYFCRSTIYITG